MTTTKTIATTSDGLTLTRDQLVALGVRIDADGNPLNFLGLPWPVNHPLPHPKQGEVIETKTACPLCGSTKAGRAVYGHFLCEGRRCENDYDHETGEWDDDGTYVPVSDRAQRRAESGWAQ